MQSKGIYPQYFFLMLKFQIKGVSNFSDFCEIDFLANTFLLLTSSGWNFPESPQENPRNWWPSLNKIDQQTKNFPIDPHCKNTQTFTMDVNGRHPLNFYNGALWGFFLFMYQFCSNLAISYEGFPEAIQENLNLKK